MTATIERSAVRSFSRTQARGLDRLVIRVSLTALVWARRRADRAQLSREQHQQRYQLAREQEQRDHRLHRMGRAL